MKALRCQADGPFEDLRAEGESDSQPDPGQLLIDVKAASIDLPDMHIAQGRWQFKPALLRRLDCSLASCEG